MTATKLKPDWAGEDWLSRLVNILIRTKPIYAVMKHQARQVLIKTAEQKGVAWRHIVQELNTPQVRDLAAALTNTQVIYPDYYQLPFHAYDQGNLCWQAAFEAAPATYSMALRVWPAETLTWEEAQHRLRHSFHQVLDRYGPKSVADILDIGCSVGISTLALHRHYAETQAQPARTVGLDLSPYMLAVAKTRDTDNEISDWIHAQAEDTGLPAASFDLVTLQFVTHELPHKAALRIFRESWRLLRPGGAIAVVDNNPKSPVIQNLSPILFTLMKSTEPWSDDYYTFDLENALVQVGFETPVTVASDPRHRTIVAKRGNGE